MRTVVVEGVVPDASSADAVFAGVLDFGAYAQHTNAVRSVVVTRGPDGTAESAWSVSFRNGVLAWVEQDVVDPGSRRIGFTQTEGDFETFTGEWTVVPDGATVTVRFTACFDLGMPSLAAMIDPIAEQALTDNVRAILRGLLGERVQFPWLTARA
jgi:ribosome-associated toxin RatA of RatAB toxin-antitoxin module